MAERSSPLTPGATFTTRDVAQPAVPPPPPAPPPLPPPAPPVPGPPPPAPPPPTAVSVTGLPRPVTINRLGRLTLAFSAKPAGLQGRVTLMTPKPRRGKALTLGSASFRTSPAGKVTLALVVGKRTLRQLRLRRAKRAHAVITL